MLILGLMLLGCSSPDDADKKVQYWETELNKSLSTGNSKEEIRTYLKNSGLDYGYNEHTKTFVALDQKVENYIFTTYSIAINIELDENEKLQRIKVYKQ